MMTLDIYGHLYLESFDAVTDLLDEIFTQVSTGREHSCAIKTDGTVECWGYFGSGARYAPSGVFTQVSAGRDHNCGVKTDGTVECWGSLPRLATPPDGIFTQVSAGWSHTCGIRTDGSVECWGSEFGDRLAIPEPCADLRFAGPSCNQCA